MTPEEYADRIASVIEAHGVNGLGAATWNGIKRGVAALVRQAMEEGREACAQVAERPKQSQPAVCEVCGEPAAVFVSIARGQRESMLSGKIAPGLIEHHCYCESCNRAVCAEEKSKTR